MRLYFIDGDSGSGKTAVMLHLKELLGVLHKEGVCITKDYEEAVKLYQLSADPWFAPAQFYLGLMYENGLDVPQDLKEAERYFKLAVDQGYTGK